MSQEWKAVQTPKAHKKSDTGKGKRVRLTQQAIVAAAAELFARKGVRRNQPRRHRRHTRGDQRRILLSRQKQRGDSAPDLPDGANS